MDFKNCHELIGKNIWQRFPSIPGGMGGHETLTHLMAIDPQVKAIVSSGYANDPIIANYQKYGFAGVVTKPYKFDELNEVLAKITMKK